jgi:mRNA interferase YafQ
MHTPVYTRQFERDIRKAEKRGKNLGKLKIIVRTLIEGGKLDALHRDHQMAGNYAGRRECHIEGDWLLIYKIEKDRIIFERTGSHSDLFKQY